jgi:glycosyltransferase involved in cell wall biosynthesis
MKQHLHIAYLVSHYPHKAFNDDGGLGTSVYNLAERIRRENHRVSVFVYGQKSSFVIEEENLKIYSIEELHASFLKFYFHRKHIEKFIKARIKLDKIDLLEVPDWTGITAFMNFSIPVVVRFHGSDTYFCHLEKRKQKLQNFLFEKLAVRNADAYIGPTEFAGKLSQKLFKIENRSVQTIHYGLELENFQNHEPNHFESGLILYIGTIIRKKGVLELPDIFRLVLKNHPNAKLVLIGGDAYDIATDRASTWELVESKLGDAMDNASYLGKIPYQQVQEYIKKAHVCVFPTFAETLGMVTIESMALQKPVVNSNIGWANELIDDGVNGFLVHPADHRLYAERISEILRSEELPKTLGKAARKKVEADFDIKKIVNLNIDFYTDVINNF